VRIWRGLRDPLGYLSGLEETLGGVVTLKRGRYYAVFDPSHIKHILQDNHRNYVKGEMYRAALSPLMGNGLVTSEGEFWLRQRRIAQGAFQRAHMSQFVPPILDSVAGMAAEWERKSRAGETVALREELTTLTLRIALRSLFGTDAEPQMERLVEASFGVNEEIRLEAAFLPVRLPEWVPTPGRRRFSRSLKVIDEFVYGVIGGRKRAADPGSDLVGLLIRAQDPETGERMDDLQLRDELVTMWNAGHDTVTDSVVWTLALLAQHPEAMERVRAEAAAAGEGLTLASAGGMEYLERVFREALRLFPPAWGFARTALGEDTIGGYRIPAGALVVLSPYVTHRSGRYWERPLEFEPDRFLPEASAQRAKFAYFPFGSGPRQCIGAGLASMEAPLITAALVRRFDFELAEGTRVELAPRISLRPKGSLRMRVRVRE
jgi:cytochrome P450